MKLNYLLGQINNINVEELTKKLIELIVDAIKENIKKVYYHYRIMLRNMEILGAHHYIGMVNHNEINPEDAFVYFTTDSTSNRAAFYYPFLAYTPEMLDAFLSKLEFLYIERYIAPATGLKYVAVVRSYRNEPQYLTIEVLDLDTVAKNSNLYDIVSKVLDNKLRNELTGKEFRKIVDLFESQKLFAGYNFIEARKIVANYYDHNYHNELEEKVKRITEDYRKIFQPYKVCYYGKNLEKIDCMSIKS